MLFMTLHADSHARAILPLLLAEPTGLTAPHRRGFTGGLSCASVLYILHQQQWIGLSDLPSTAQGVQLCVT